MSGFDSRLMQRTNGILYVRHGSFLDSLVDEGKLYASSPIIITDAATNKYLSLQTGPGVNTHAYIGFVSTTEAQVTAYIGPTITVPGTLAGMAPFNLTKPLTSEVQIRTDPTFSATGPKIADFLIPGGSGGNAVGGVLQSGSKVIIGPNSSFLFEIDVTSNGKMEISFIFYDEIIGAF